MDDRLLIRFFTQTCSAEEFRQIDRWIGADPEHGRRLFEMERVWSLKDELRYSDEKEVDQAYRRFEKRIRPVSKPAALLTTLFRRSRYVAAAFITLLLAGNIYLFYRDRPALSFNRIEVPKGERAVLTLSDGTQVWLNADTRFFYPSDFGKDRREVMLEGEGYFKVAADPQRPFTVKNDLFRIAVLGTEFNVRAHPDEEAGISLKTGKISLYAHPIEEALVMEPNERVRVTADGKVFLSRTDMTTLADWTRGDVAFIEEPLSVIVKTLERKYDIPIVLADQMLGKKRFTCRAKAGTTLTKVLDLLRKTQQITYRMENNRIVITKK